MENQTPLNGAVLIGSLRTRLMYRTRDAMATNWQQVFPDEFLPDDHISVSTEKVGLFLESLAKPQRGRSAAITGAAVVMLGEIAEAKNPTPEILPAPLPSELPEQTPAPPPASVKVETKRNSFQILCLFIAFLIPTVASISNVYRIAHMMSDNPFTAKMITVVLSATALLFVAANLRNWFSVLVVLGLICFEAFCNLAATYRALIGTAMYGDHLSGKVSDFLDTVTSVTNSSFQGTAVFLGAAVGIALAAVQFAAFFEIKKSFK